VLEVIAVCSRCRKTVQDGDGGLSVSWDEIWRARIFRLRSLKLLLTAGLMRLQRPHQVWCQPPGLGELHRLRLLLLRLDPGADGGRSEAQPTRLLAEPDVGEAAVLDHVPDRVAGHPEEPGDLLGRPEWLVHATKCGVRASQRKSVDASLVGKHPAYGQ
jgi:hypothetical protein